MQTLVRYGRLWLALGRFGLVRELAFRGNFLVKVTVELLWLVILLVFWFTVFTYTKQIADWTLPQYMFFVGCYMALEGLLETFFLSNCGEFSDLVRSGDLDFALLKPIDEQFLITCRSIDWTTLPNVLLGVGVMINALIALEWEFDPIKIGLFLVLMACSLAMAYSFLLMLASSAVWMVRNQSLFELWWLFTTLVRYPREIFSSSWAAPIGRFFTYVIPVMLIINVPANVMVRVFDGWMIALALAMTALLLWASRRFFRLALSRYRSASS
ncbi:MAG TPA: ABC-2 family transporter protein [Gemmataceae bacterium]|nr:ABC-2 family transporter protein [Gemmataceae bacterium]